MNADKLAEMTISMFLSASRWIKELIHLTKFHNCHLVLSHIGYGLVTAEEFPLWLTTSIVIQPVIVTRLRSPRVSSEGHTPILRSTRLTKLSIIALFKHLFRMKTHFIHLCCACSMINKHHRESLLTAEWSFVTFERCNNYCKLSYISCHWDMWLYSGLECHLMDIYENDWPLRQFLWDFDLKFAEAQHTHTVVMEKRCYRPFCELRAKTTSPIM